MRDRFKASRELKNTRQTLSWFTTTGSAACVPIQGACPAGAKINPSLRHLTLEFHLIAGLGPSFGARSEIDRFWFRALHHDGASADECVVAKLD
jgi:hypothetical protein